MADTKISALSAVTDVLATDEYVLARSGASKKITAANMKPAIVTSLPGSPSDLDEIYLKLGSGDTAILWHLKYDSGISDAYKWRFLGGPALAAYQETSGSTSSGTYVELNSGAPSVTLPSTGVYSIHHGCKSTVTGGTSWILANIKTNGTNPANDDDSVQAKPVGTDTTVSSARVIQRTVASISTSALLVQVYRCAGATEVVTSRFVAVYPMRIG